MKHFTLLALTGIMALGAQAQYNCNPSTADVVKAGAKSIDYITLSEGAIQEFEAAGAKLTYVGPDADNGRNLWYWENTFAPGDESYPRVDFEEGGYISVVVGTVGWSGAGVAVDNGLDFSNFNDATHFHMAYMTPTGNGPASVAVILLDGGDKGSAPAKFALGTAFDDNGAIFPTIGATISDDWQGLDVTLGDLKKIWPSFDLQNKSSWTGNLFSWLGGGVTGQTMAFDAIYFYNTGDSGVEGVDAEGVDFIVTDRTVNVCGAMGIELFDMAGRLVKKSSGSVLGIQDLGQGVYVARAAGKVKKIMVH